MTADEIRAELAEIAAEATGWRGWKWAGGMHDETGCVIMLRSFYGEDDRPAAYDTTAWRIEAEPPARPDFTDPATIGCLVARLIAVDADNAPERWAHVCGDEYDGWIKGSFDRDTPIHCPDNYWLGYCLAVARAAREVLS